MTEVEATIHPVRHTHAKTLWLALDVDCGAVGIASTRQFHDHLDGKTGLRTAPFDQRMVHADAKSQFTGPTKAECPL